VDRNNLFIEDLTTDEIEILENEQPRPVEFIAKDELPTVYGMLFDRRMLGEHPEDERLSSRGVPGAMGARNVAYELIDKYFGKQTIWVGSFWKTPQVELEFTSDGFQAHRAIQQIRGQRSMEDSSLYGAALWSIQRMNERHEKRRVLLFFLESVDAQTLDRLRPLKNALSASNVEAYFLRFGSRLAGRSSMVSPQMSEAALRDLAATTAGEVFMAASYGLHMEDMTRRVRNHIRTLYTFGFQATSPADNPGRLEIRCLRPGSKVHGRSTVPSLP